MIYKSELPFVPVLGIKVSVTTASSQSTGLKIGGIYSVTNIGTGIVYLNPAGADATDVCFPVLPSTQIKKIMLPKGTLNHIASVTSIIVINEIVDADEYR